MLKFVASTTAVILAATLAGCAADGSLETASLSAQSQAAKADPTCTALVTHIADLRRDGIAEKIEKAANKKYKMTNADLIKADQLNKANGEFQTKCAPQPTQAAAAATPPPAQQ